MPKNSYNRRFIDKWMFELDKLVWRGEKTRLTNPEVNSGRASIKKKREGGSDRGMQNEQ